MKETEEDIDLEALARNAVMMDGSAQKINKRLGGRGAIVTDAKFVYYFMRGHGDSRAVDILTFQDPRNPNTAAFYRFSESNIVPIGGVTLSSYEPHARGRALVDLMKAYPILVSAGEMEVEPMMKRPVMQ